MTGLTLMKKPLFTAKAAFLALVLVVLHSFSGSAKSAQEEHGTEDKPFNANEVIIEHVMDAHQWHVMDHLVIPLPIILYSSERGLDIFSSSHFYNEHHEAVEYNGYRLEENHILGKPDERVIDLSVTKNVAMLFINATLLLLVFLSVGSACKKNAGRAPRGLQSFIVLFLFVMKL
jgi:F-type H+-transporting ATPase subunit a